MGNPTKNVMDNNGRLSDIVISAILLEFKEQTCAYTSDDWEFIALPFVNRINDGIGFYVKRDTSRNVICFSDDGEAVDNFTLRGNSISTAEIVVSSYGYGGVYVSDGEIVAEAKPGEEGKTALAFINALLELFFA